MKAITVAWFSGGTSSAISTKMMIDEIDHIIFQDIEDHHEDTMRFVMDCQKWFGKEIEIQKSPYGSVNNACKGAAFVRGPHGAACTRLLKIRERQIWEAQNRFFCNFRYIWGMDANETTRADRIRYESMPDEEHIFPLLENGIDKPEAHAILARAGIKRHAMYDMGYPNANCRVCTKGGMGYMNKCRVDFPDWFWARARMEREVGASCINGVFLDELDPDRGRDCEIILPECGMMCEILDSPASPTLGGK